MAKSKSNVIDGAVNTSTFNAAEYVAACLRDAPGGQNPFEPANDDECEAFTEAEWRGGLVEWTRNSYGRCVQGVGEPGLPTQEWLPFDKLYRAILAVPLPETVRRGFKLAESQKRLDARRDTDFFGWSNFAFVQYGLQLGGTRGGYYVAKIAETPLSPVALRPWPDYGKPAGTELFRSKDLAAIGAYLNTLPMSKWLQQSLEREVSGSKEFA